LSVQNPPVPAASNSAQAARVAIVTGGTGAIGSAIGARLQAAGQRVVAADLDVRPVPEGQTFFACDVTDPASIEKLLVFAADIGPVACIVAAHGILLETPAGAADLSAVSRILDVNLKGVAYLCDLAGRHLAPPASIVLISSWTAFAGRIRNGYGYQAAKAGLESLTRTFAAAYGPNGVRVNAVAPGFMADPMKGMGAEMRARQGGMDGVIQGAPLRKLVTAAEVASAVAFLCSNEASAITGVVLPVDAGYRAL
jgi:NAD(P)-dependent dehydrogenase (short-subunit alcohol dehydrogenase family)